MGLVGEWEQIQTVMPDDWADAQLALRVRDEQDESRAASLLGPLTPGRREREFRIEVVRNGAGPSALSVARVLARLDGAGISAGLELVYAETAAPGRESAPARTLVESWDAALAALPADWSDVYVDLALTSSDHLDPAALALSPVNPARSGAAPGFRFRCARRFGYGAAPEMVRRCLSRLDEREIPADLEILWVLSDTHAVGTQGPVWYVEGKVV